MPDSNSVVIVTGASSGIGRAAAIEFSRHKYRVSLSGRNEDEMLKVLKECEAAGAQNVTTTIGDLRDSTIAHDLVEHTVKKFGRLDVLVNCAGILVNGTVEESDLKSYDKVFDVNVRSVIQLTKYAIPHLVKTEGSIVNVSSVAGPCAFPGVTYYCMSKAALDQFTKCLALELAPKGVRVNAVNPGVIVTSIHKRAGMSEEEYAKHLVFSSSPTQRRRTRWAVQGTSEEVAKGIFFLASKDAAFTTGHLLMQDGGRNLMTPR
ncbi:Short-chain dehydrogenase reductase SDR domain containing protein [Aphelenchoides fujianensis]|nr:Short-chain dehydrogenase reductase SDR domain containing protein [Aphelenchoides fujianensis]